MKLNDVDLNKLSTFHAVVAAGGVGKAARRLGRTGSAVSQSLGGLEASLGCKLFDRVGKELVLTRAGQLLHTRLSAFEALLSSTLNEIGPDGAEVSGSIGLGLFLGFPRVQTRELITLFTERYPRATVRVVYAPQHELEARLRRNRLDFVLSFRPRSVDSPDLVSTRVFAEELVLVSSGRYFETGFSLEELAETPVVDYYQSDPLILRWLAHHFPSRRIEPRVRCWAATTDLALELVQSGAGVGVLPRYMLPVPAAERALGKRSRNDSRLRGGNARKPALAGSNLKEIDPAGKPLVDHVWLNEPRDAYRDVTQKAFRAVVLSVLAPASGPVRGTACGS
jgi:DNA-binding transcriptional LysR family regulator